MLTEIKTLFDFHPKEQKGIVGLAVLIFGVSCASYLYDHWLVRPPLHASLSTALIDSLNQTALRYQFAIDSENTIGSDEQSDLAFERHKPFQQRENWTQDYPRDSEHQIFFGDNHTPIENYPPKKKQIGLLEINSADSIQWLMVRGIGPYTTHKILSYRDKLGGFTSIDQLKEIYKIDPLLFDTCGTQFTCSIEHLKRIHVNHCTLQELDKHPYLNKSQAKTIISYREMHGSFSSINDLNKVALLDQNTLNKIIPYLTIE